MNHFSETFFSKSAKRLDLHLNAELHKEEQEEYREINSKHEIMKHLERVNYTDDLNGFKNQIGFHPDTYKTYYSQFLEQK